jgi:hypothetical protein
MRFYSIIITQPEIIPAWAPSKAYNFLAEGVTPKAEKSKNPGQVVVRWDSFDLTTGDHNPNCPMVVFDIQAAPLNMPVNNSVVRIFGVPLYEIGQAWQLIGKNIAIYGGMSEGLPLANKFQAGLLAKGTIYQSFGNWVGTEQSLDLAIAPAASLPTPITLEYKPKTPLGTMIKNTLNKYYPQLPVDMSQFDNSQAVIYTDNAAFRNITELCQWLAKTPGYKDVRIVEQTGVFKVSNAKGREKNGNEPRQISPLDLLGQPTWIDYATISIILVMRADIEVGTRFVLPTTMLISPPVMQGNINRERTMGSFQGTFIANSVRHIGQNRATDAMGWATIVEAGQVPDVPPKSAPKMKSIK